MKSIRLKNWLLGAASLGILTIAVALVSPSRSYSQGGPPPPSQNPPQNVNVVNTPTVRDVGEFAARNAMQQSFSLSFADVQVGTLETIFNVPLGKRLVIEHASFHVSLPVGQNLYQAEIRTHVGSNLGIHSLVLTPRGTTNNPSLVAYVGSQPSRLYADGGTAVEFSAVRSSAAGSWPISGTFSGYLVDLP